MDEQQVIDDILDIIEEAEDGGLSQEWLQCCRYIRYKVQEYEEKMCH